VREIPVEIVKEIPVYIKVDPTEWDSRHNLRSYNMTSAYPTGMYVMRMYIYIASQHERERERERKRERERERERDPHQELYIGPQQEGYQWGHIPVG